MDPNDLTPENTEIPDITPETVELLASAEVDGDFDAVASELGHDPAALRRALSTTDFAALVERFAALRAELSGPTDAPAPTLSEIDRRRLRAGAFAAVDEGPERDAVAPATSVTGASRRAGARGRVLGVAAAVAAVVVIGAGVFAVTRSDDASENRADSAADATTTISAGPEATKGAGDTVIALGNLGDVSNPGDLRGAIERALATDDSSTGETTSPGSTTTIGAGSTTPTPAAPDGDCLGALAAATGGPGTLRARATGTDTGRPVTILVFDTGDRTTVWVLDSSDCHVIASQSF